MPLSLSAMRGQFWTWAAPISAMAVFSISVSLSVPLFSLLLERAGHSGMVIGINHSMAAMAMVFAAPLLPLVLRRIGIVPLMLWSAAILAVSMAAIPVSQSVWWYSVLRVGWGIAGTALFFASEFWLISVVPEAVRGRIVGLYALVLSGSYMIGPRLLNLLGTDSWMTYAVPTAIIVLGAIPIVLGRKAAPAAATEAPKSPLAMLRFFRSDPMVLWGVVLFGVIEFGAMGLIAVWGLRTGFDQITSVELVFWLAFGSMAFQLPVGWAAERYNRRYMLAIAGVIALAAPLVIIAVSSSLFATAATVFVWGGMAVAFYSLALIELGARYQGSTLADATAALVLAYGIGALLTPTAFGAAMDAVPPDGLLWLAALSAGMYCVLAAVRLTRHPAKTS